MLTCQADPRYAPAPEDFSTRDITVARRSDPIHGRVLVATAELGIFGKVSMQTPVAVEESEEEAADRLLKSYRSRAWELGYIVE
jgi:hypothetical protein